MKLSIFVLLLAQFVFSQYVFKYPNVDSVSIREGVSYKFMAAKDMNYGRNAGATDWGIDDSLSIGRVIDTITITFQHKIFDGKVHLLTGYNIWTGGSWWYLKTTNNSSVESTPHQLVLNRIVKSYTYDINGRLIDASNLRTGVYFVRTGKVIKRISVIK